MKRILITGAGGQLGQELVQFLSPDAEVMATTRSQLDLSQPNQIFSIVTDFAPQIIINAGAYTAVDKAESEPELAEMVNGISPGILAKAAQSLGGKLIHVSTDYVFDGTQHRPYLEMDLTNPVSVYGRSKLSGENAIQAVDGDYAIVRTAWVYGAGKTGNFVKTMLRLGSEREELRVVCDQIGSPTWTKDLARAIVGLTDSTATGIYHYTNSGVASWYDFAVAIFEEAKRLGVPLKVERVIPISTEQYPTPAKRPAFSVLSTVKLSELLGNYPPHWRQALRQMLPEWVSSY